jgi:hypothetical protein
LPQDWKKKMRMRLLAAQVYNYYTSILFGLIW